MDFDPHSLHHIIHRIRQQMRCPQCGEKIPVDFPSLRVTNDEFVMLQLRCDTCDAYVVLNASLQNVKNMASSPEECQRIMNASSTLCEKDTELEALRSTLSTAGGSFTGVFGEVKKSE